MTRTITTRIHAIGVATLLAVMTLASATAQAADVALVIGNSDYRQAPDAVAADADARLIADALSDGGYDVTLGLDLNRNQMRNHLSRFARKLGDADRVVIYFSGHALRSDGRTYLAPTDQRNTSLVPVMMDGVPLDLVLRLAGTRSGRAVVFLDAAQFDGFTPNAVSEPGLAQISAPNGVLVVSAAAPGRAIRRTGTGTSRFARDVEDAFLRPGARTMEVTSRIARPAWTTGSVQPRIRLVTRGGAGGAGGSVNAASPQKIEDNLNLTRAQRREVQETLSMLGHDPRGIDGVFGPGTRTAIRLWQRENNAIETGYLNADQHALLRQQAREAGPSRDDQAWERAVSRGTGDAYRDYLVEYPDGRNADAARDALKRMARSGTDSIAQRERRYWSRVLDENRAASYRAYLDRYPYGIWKPEAEDRIAELTGTRPNYGQQNGGQQNGDPAEVEQALNLTRNDRLSIEQRLNYLGFPPGAQDGFFDSSTRWAIEGYQRDRDFDVTGYLSRPLLQQLVEETGGGGQGIVIDGATVLRNLLRGLGE